MTPTSPAKAPRGAVQRRGTTMFEFAMFLSVLCAALLGVSEFCRVAVIRHTVDNAVYEACRVGMKADADAADCERHARAVLQSIGMIRARVAVEPKVFDKATEQVTVRIEVPLEMNSLMPNPFVADQAVVRELTLRRPGRGRSSAGMKRGPSAVAHPLSTSDE